MPSWSTSLSSGLRLWWGALSYGDWFLCGMVYLGRLVVNGADHSSVLRLQCWQLVGGLHYENSAICRSGACACDGGIRAKSNAQHDAEPESHALGRDLIRIRGHRVRARCGEWRARRSRARQTRCATRTERRSEE